MKTRLAYLRRFRVYGRSGRTFARIVSVDPRKERERPCATTNVVQSLSLSLLAGWAEGNQTRCRCWQKTVRRQANNLRKQGQRAVEEIRKVPGECKAWYIW